MGQGRQVGQVEIVWRAVGYGGDQRHLRVEVGGLTKAMAAVARRSIYGTRASMPKPVHVTKCAGETPTLDEIRAALARDAEAAEYTAWARGFEGRRS